MFADVRGVGFLPPKKGIKNLKLPIAVPETSTPSKLSSQPDGGITTRSPGTKSSDEIFSSTSLPRRIVTTSVDWRRRQKTFFFSVADDSDKWARAGKSHWRGGLSTVDLLVLTSLHQLLLILKILFTFFTRQRNLMRRLMVLSLPPQLVFLG